MESGDMEFTGGRSRGRLQKSRIYAGDLGMWWIW